MSASLSFKLYFSQVGSDDVDFIKRVRASSSPTWEAFQELLCSLFPTKKNLSFVIKWKDEDGDMILVGSEPEWQEALACCVSWPLKLYVNIKLDEQTAEPADKEDAPEKEDIDEELPPPFSMVPEGFYCEDGEEEPSVDEQRHLTETVPAIITQLAGPSGTLPGWIMESIAATASNGDVLLDVNIPRFSLALHSRALNLMVRADNTPVETEVLALDREAVSLLRHCVRLTPGDRNANFNLACGLSRLGLIVHAFPPLGKYVALGGEVENVYTDADLENVRKSPLFAEFEKRLPKPQKEEEKEEEKEKEKEEKEEKKVEEPSAPVEEPSSSEPDRWAEELKALQELGITDDIGRLLLEDSEGDLDAIVAAQFQSQFLE